jgi:hypothetical protein
MWTDPIIEELHAQRREHAALFGFDPHKIFANLRKLDETPSPIEDAPLVTLPPKSPKQVLKAA